MLCIYISLGPWETCKRTSWDALSSGKNMHNFQIFGNSCSGTLALSHPTKFLYFSWVNQGRANLGESAEEYFRTKNLSLSVPLLCCQNSTFIYHKIWINGYKILSCMFYLCQVHRFPKLDHFPWSTFKYFREKAFFPLSHFWSMKEGFNQEVLCLFKWEIIKIPGNL